MTAHWQLTALLALTVAFAALTVALLAVSL
jgi:hypothetical protein